MVANAFQLKNHNQKHITKADDTLFYHIDSIFKKHYINKTQAKNPIHLQRDNMGSANRHIAHPVAMWVIEVLVLLCQLVLFADASSHDSYTLSYKQLKCSCHLTKPGSSHTRAPPFVFLRVASSVCFVPTAGKLPLLQQFKRKKLLIGKMFFFNDLTKQGSLPHNVITR